MRARSILYILGLFFAGIVAFSCTDDIDGGEGNKPAPAGEGYLSVDVDLGNVAPVTRSGDEAGTAEELKVHSVRVALYAEDALGNGVWRVKYAFEFGIDTPASWTNPGDLSGWLTGANVDLGKTEDNVITPSGQHLYTHNKSGNTYRFVSFAQRVEKVPYKMVVILNGKDVILSSGENTIYDITKKGATLVQLNNEIKAEIVATNGAIKGGKGILMMNHQGPVDVAVNQLKGTANEANSAPVEVSVDRLVAKVTVKHASGFVFPQGVAQNSVTWGLATTNKKTYWMRRMIGTESPQTSMANLYAEDPNFDMVGVSFWDDHFNNHFTSTTEGVSFDPTKISNSLGEYEYVLENTISAVSAADNSAHINQTTHIILGYKYTPSGYAANESYYVYKNKVISKTEMIGYRNTPSSIPASLSGLSAIFGTIDETKYPLDGSGTEYFEVPGGLRFCLKGQLYYAFPIRHFDQSEGSQGYYGVVRNNIYEITVSSLTPPEEVGPFISAKIHIQPWAMRGQTNTIGVDVIERIWKPVKVYHWYKDINLYEEWTYKKGMPVARYETILYPVNGTMVCEHYQKSLLFSSLGYGAINFTYSNPSSTLRVVDGDNEMHLYYTLGYIFISIRANQQICFVDENLRILNVQATSPSTGSIFTNNPGAWGDYWISFARQVSDPVTGYIFVRNLYDEYKLKITDPIGGAEYKISDNLNFTRFYQINQTTATHVVPGTYDEGLMPEPIEVGDITTGTVLGSRGLAIICTPK